MSDDEQTRGRQLLLSELEGRERRKLIALRHPGDAVLADMIVAHDWFQVLTLAEVEELSSLPGWDWDRFADAEEAEWGPLDLHGLIRGHLEGWMVFLVEEADEIVYHAITEGEEGLTEAIQGMRAIARRYAVDLGEVWRAHQEDERRGRLASGK